MKILEELRKISEVGRRFPHSFFGIVVEAFPFNEVMQFASTKFRVKNCVDFPFQLIFNDYWFGRRKSFSWVRTLGWLEERNMGNWMYLPRRGNLKSERGF